MPANRGACRARRSVDKRDESTGETKAVSPGEVWKPRCSIEKKAPAKAGLAIGKSSEFRRKHHWHCGPSCIVAFRILFPVRNSQGVYAAWPSPHLVFAVPTASEVWLEQIPDLFAFSRNFVRDCWSQSMSGLGRITLSKESFANRVQSR